MYQFAKFLINIIFIVSTILLFIDFELKQAFQIFGIVISFGLMVGISIIECFNNDKKKEKK